MRLQNRRTVRGCGKPGKPCDPTWMHLHLDNLNEGSGRESPDRVNVGTELTRLLKRFGFENKPGCKCRDRARIMDVRGVHWCEKHVEEIVDWLEEEAIRRKLPFVRRLGKWIARRAIKNANRKAGR